MTVLYISLIILFFGVSAFLFFIYRKNSKKALQYLKELRSFENIVYHTHDALFVIEIVNGKLLHVNHASSELIGYPLEELKNKTYFDLLPTDILNKSAERIADVWDNKGMVFTDIPYLHRSGEIIPVECSAKIGSFEEHPAIVIYARDIRERLKYESAIKEMNLALTEKNKDITDSISYAKRIQDSTLPSKELKCVHIQDLFVLFKPKDIVSGDFYWFMEVNGIRFIAAADCTGHGVPGALVSVVCSNALNRSVKEFGLSDPGKILDKTRELILETFSSQNNNSDSKLSDVKDGMDISLIALQKDPKSKSVTVKWSGANNPLWYIRENELKEIKADKQPIGKNDNPVPFTTHTLELDVNDTLYLFTDGYADQFGGPKGKKFKYKQLEETLLEINDKPMPTQEKILDKKLEDWKNSLHQVDDVLIIGVKL